MQEKYKHIGLFEGIGGFSLAARWMGWETVAWCEWNEFGKRVLHHYFPEAEGHGDITKTDFTKYANTIDILTGGFPCQPFSAAGKRQGTDDDRYLWPETLRMLVEIQPTYAVFENVFGLTSILESACESEVETKAVQLFSEGGDNEEVEERIREVKQRTISIIIADLEKVGYTLPETEKGEPIILCVPACSINAPHRRDRVWFVAYNATNSGWNGSHGTKDGQGNNKGNDSNPSREGTVKQPSRCSCSPTGKVTTDTNSNGYGSYDQPGEIRSAAGEGISIEEQRQRVRNEFRRNGSAGIDTNTGSEGLQGISQHREQGEESFNEQSARCVCPDWSDFPTQSPLCSGNDGLSIRLDAITFSKWRTESIKAAGNAIVPGVAFQIFKAIQEMELLKG